MNLLSCRGGVPGHLTRGVEGEPFTVRAPQCAEVGQLIGRLARSAGAEHEGRGQGDRPRSGCAYAHRDPLTRRGSSRFVTVESDAKFRIRLFTADAYQPSADCQAKSRLRSSSIPQEVGALL